MATVYLATDPNGAHVALKVTHSHYASDPEFRRRLHAEKDALCQLNHPCIAVFKDFHEDWDPPILAMEFVDGQTLKDALDEATGPWETARACHILIQIAEALAYCHKSGIIHRDIKPANILITGNDHVKVTDFGIARLKDVPSLTHAGIIVGSGHIMAPEQWQGEKLTAKVDIYALGIIAYRLLTGRYPYDGSTAELSHAHCNEHPPAPRSLNPDLAPPLADLVLSCLNKEPRLRLSSADEFISRMTKLRPLLDVYERYRFEEEIGRGSMGVVFRARRRGDGMKVAIKTLDQRLTDDTLLTRLQSEAAILARLNHRFICKLIETRESFLVMEYVSGEPLSDYLHRVDGLPVPEAILYFRDMLEALGAAHRESIIHRDLKPSNVIITDDPIARHAIVMDFGIAKLLGSSGMTRTTEGLGAIPYKAPELWERQAPGQRSDIYALGAMLFEMLTSRYAFPGPEVDDFREQHLNKPPQELPDSILAEHPKLGDVLAKCLKKNPDDRYASVDELYLDLSESVSGQQFPVTAPMVPPTPKKAKPTVLPDEEEQTRTVFLSPGEIPKASKPAKPKPVDRRLVYAGAVLIPIVVAIFWFTRFSGDDQDVNPNRPDFQDASQAIEAIPQQEEFVDPVEIPESTLLVQNSAVIPQDDMPAEDAASDDAASSPEVQVLVPTYALLQLRPVPSEGTHIVINGHDYGSERDLRLSPGTYRARVIHPEFPILDKTIRLTERDTTVDLNMRDVFANRRTAELRVALSPSSDDLVLDLALNGDSKRYTSFPISGLNLIAGSWRFLPRLTSPGGAVSGNITVDSCVSFPYGGGPRVVITSTQREIDFSGNQWAGKRLIPIQIFWSQR